MNAMKINRIITIWGILDLCAIGWYVLWRIFHQQMPIFFDVKKSIETAKSFEHFITIVITVLSLILYLSLIPSGILLLKKNKFAAIIAYIQTPFRIITLIPPSVFFITWPLKHIFGDPKAILAIITFLILVMLSELLKIGSVLKWRKQAYIA